MSAVVFARWFDGNRISYDVQYLHYAVGTIFDGESLVHIQDVLSGERES